MQNLRIFCHKLRALMWGKIEPKSTFVEKKWQISGLSTTWQGDHPSTASQLRIAPPDYDQMIFSLDQNDEIDKKHHAIWMSTRTWTEHWSDAQMIASEYIIINHILQLTEPKNYG